MTTESAKMVEKMTKALEKAEKVETLEQLETLISKVKKAQREFETYTQEQINSLISAAASLKLEVVSVLPTTDISTSTIYLKGTETTETNDYEEWIYVNDNWELIGTTAIDLTGYLTETDLQNVMTQKNACIMPKKYIDVLDGIKNEGLPWMNTLLEEHGELVIKKFRDV